MKKHFIALVLVAMIASTTIVAQEVAQNNTVINSEIKQNENSEMEKSLSSEISHSQIDIASVREFPLKRKRGKLATYSKESNDFKKLNSEELTDLLSESQYSKYKKARSCYIAAIPLLSVSGLYFLYSVYFFRVAYPFERGSMVANQIGFITLGASMLCFIPGITLISVGTAKLNNIANEYNQQHHLANPSASLSFGGTNSGIGLRLTF